MAVTKKSSCGNSRVPMVVVAAPNKWKGSAATDRENFWHSSQVKGARKRCNQKTLTEPTAARQGLTASGQLDLQPRGGTRAAACC
ncbi:hypothetical protein KQX54_005709 [Cotesia glomerata]|uniref:Uncharacterized protein n=1 Tax=Cotesia glomerata TaxID=32391 RepID=A0AAV7J4I8_COTGL|nr:hypothetical protein KQX54_005709 [Cotesia glomerata]